MVSHVTECSQKKKKKSFKKKGVKGKNMINYEI